MNINKRDRILSKTGEDIRKRYNLDTLINKIKEFNTYFSQDSTLSVVYGGTGKNFFTEGSYLVGNGDNTISEKTIAQLINDLGIQDYIIQKEESGAWEVIQWASGEIQISSKIQVENNTTSQWGSIYYGLSKITLPTIVQNTTIKNIQVTPASAILFFVMGAYVTNNEINVYCARGASASTQITMYITLTAQK